MLRDIFRINDWRFGIKVGVSLVLLALLPVSITSAVLSLNTANALEDQATQQVEGMGEAEATQLEAWFEERRSDVRALSSSPSLVDAMNGLEGGFEELVDTLGSQSAAEDYIRSRYLGNMELANARDDSTYTAAHAEYTEFLNHYAQLHGYNDLYLIANDGDVVYTTAKEEDFGRNLLTGPYSDTNLSVAFRQVSLSDDPSFVMIEDFEFYEPVGDVAGFLITPVFDGTRRIGSLAFEFPIDELNATVGHYDSLGETGESYIVGSDYLFRSQVRFQDELGVESLILNTNVVEDTEAVKTALTTHDHGVGTVEDYLGRQSLAAWHPLTVQESVEGIDPEGVTWVIISKYEESEIFAHVQQAQTIAVVATVIAAVAALGVAFILSRFLTRQANELGRVFDAVRVGEFDARAKVYSRDELGQVADGMNALLDQVLNLLDETETQREGLERAVNKLVEEVSELAAGDLSIFADVEEGTATKEVAEALNYAIQELRNLVSNINAVSGQMATETSSISEAVRVVVTQAESSVQIVSDAELSATEGDRAVTETVMAMNRIRANTQETSQRIKRLGEVSQEISEFVRLIEEIADRTTVLALNASIQAAAAGDAGRGFAVVAEEVQRLAERATEAARSIEELVSNIQAETNQATIGAEEVTRVVVEGSQLAEQAGERMSELNAMVSRLAEIIRQTADTASQQTVAAVNTLTNLSGTLQESIAAFELQAGARSSGD